MGHRYATPPTCSSGWRYCGEPATLAGRHVAAYLFQNFPSPLLQLFVVVEPEHSGEGRFHHVRWWCGRRDRPSGEPCDVLGKTPPYQQTRAKGEPIVKLAALAKSLHSLSVFRQGFPIIGVQIGWE